MRLGAAALPGDDARVSREEELEEIRARFEREVQEWAEGGVVGGRVDPEEARRAVRESFIGILREQLRVRACPPEKIELLLVDVEVAPDGSETGFDILVPPEAMTYLRRPPVRYDPGRPPV